MTFFVTDIFAESQQPPQFTTEIVDARVQEGEEAKFECFYAGNPKPGKIEQPIREFFVFGQIRKKNPHFKFSK